MLQTICNDIGKIMLEGCANAGSDDAALYGYS